MINQFDGTSVCQHPTNTENRLSPKLNIGNCFGKGLNVHPMIVKCGGMLNWDTMHCTMQMMIRSDYFQAEEVYCQ